MTGAEFVGWLFLFSLGFWATGYAIGSVIKMLNR